MIQLTEFDHCDDDGKARAVETRGAHFNVVETPEQILHAIGVAKAVGDE